MSHTDTINPRRSVASPAQSLNLNCICQTLEMQRLREQLETAPELTGLTERLAHSHPHLISQTAVFLDASVLTEIEQAIEAIEHLVALPHWQEQVLARAPDIARLAYGPAGVLMGYDFHLTDDGPRLIEINSNAGGAFLNAVLAGAHRACCDAFLPVMEKPAQTALSQSLVEMFAEEWQLQRGRQPWRNILIVDDAPSSQYLEPEFQIARAWFAAKGLIAVIADAADLQWRDGVLWHPALPPDMPVDMVYNRLTDFYLAQPQHAALLQAYRSGATVVTPHPRTHALYANKYNLIEMGDSSLLARWGVRSSVQAVLHKVVPTTQRVTTTQADTLWAQRRQLFFKPAAGFGSRAAYRGDKLTRRVWEEIVQGDYVAQTTIPPSERLVLVNGAAVRLKVDVRAYTYQGQIVVMAARTWAGQTTNFRTEGGGFSPVMVVPDITQHPLASCHLPLATCHGNHCTPRTERTDDDAGTATPA